MTTGQNKQAQHAEKLRELGFSPIDKELSVQVRNQVSRTERRLLRKQKYRPWFTMSELVTFATDETGQTWSGPANTDLASLGYENKTADAQSDLKTYRNTSRRYH